MATIWFLFQAKKENYIKLHNYIRINIVVI